MSTFTKTTPTCSNVYLIDENLCAGNTLNLLNYNVKSLSANVAYLENYQQKWNGLYSAFQTYSAVWVKSVDNVTALSAGWLDYATTVNNLSSSWNKPYTVYYPQMLKYDVLYDNPTQKIPINTGVGEGFQTIAITPDGKKAYVTDFSNYIYVIDTSTNTITKTITGVNVYAIVMSPRQNKAYASTFDTQVLVINTLTDTVTKTITTEPSTAGITISPDGDYVYVANYSPGKITVIDTGSDAIIKTITAFVGILSPITLAVSPDGTKLYVLDYAGLGIYIYSIISDTTIGSFGGSYIISTSALLISPDGNRIYTNDFNNIYIFETVTNTLIKTININNNNTMGLSPDGTTLYIGNNDINSAYNINAIDTYSYNIVKLPYTQTCASTIALTPDGTTLYISDSCNNNVIVLSSLYSSLVFFVNNWLNTNFSPSFYTDQQIINVTVYFYEELDCNFNFSRSYVETCIPNCAGISVACGPGTCPPLYQGCNHHGGLAGVKACDNLYSYCSQVPTFGQPQNVACTGSGGRTLYVNLNQYATDTHVVKTLNISFINNNNSWNSIT